MPTVALYREAKATTVALVSGLRLDELGQTCRACPDWSLQDVVAHHVHVVTTHLAGGLPLATYTAIVGDDDQQRANAAKARDEWTDEGVVARRGRSLVSLLAEWDRAVEALDDEGAGAALDLVVHLDDIAETLGRPAPEPGELRDAVLTLWNRAFVRPRLGGIGLTVDLLATDTGRRWGKGAAPTVSGPTYELLRTVCGRRTRAEADRALDWGDTPEPARELLPAYGWPI